MHFIAIILRIALIFVIIFSMVLPALAEPSLKDKDFVVQKLVTGLESPTTMAFVGNDIFVLQKENGQVRLVRDGVLQQNPVLVVHVKGGGEQGLLGITYSNPYVYLYYTEAPNGTQPAVNRIYRYDWDGLQLVYPLLIKSLPGANHYHNGGAMVTSLNGSVYAVIGDNGNYGELQNHPSGGINDTSVILRVVPPGPYYAIGIRNSFGLAVDPVNGNLWDTENGPTYGDEINLVPPNFNSGWDVVMGPANKTQLSEIANLPNYKNYVYHDPQFTWKKPVAPTGLTFIDSSPFEKYKNSLFVTDCNNGNLYGFELNKNRDGFVFNSTQLQNNIVKTGDSMDEIIFGTGFGCATDVVAGPDGLLYVVSLTDGIIYKISPKNESLSQEIFGTNLDPYTKYIEYGIIGIIIPASILYLKRRSNQKIKINQKN